MSVIVLIGDIIGSREVADRKGLQEHFSSVLNQANHENSDLLSPFTITLGDEFQAVYKSSGRLFQDIWSILAGMYPSKVRFAVGIGKLTTPINPEQAIGMDGPAFHYARSGIQELKESSYLFRIDGENLPGQNLLNQCLFLLSHICQGWEKNRFTILAGLMKNNTAKMLAAELGISTVAVYKNINAGALDVVMTMGKEISRQIDPALGTR